MKSKFENFDFLRDCQVMYSVYFKKERATCRVVVEGEA